MVSRGAMTHSSTPRGSMARLGDEVVVRAVDGEGEDDMVGGVEPCVSSGHRE